MTRTDNLIADDGATHEFSPIMSAHILDGKTGIAVAADCRHVAAYRNGDRLSFGEFRHESCINPIRH